MTARNLQLKSMKTVIIRDRKPKTTTAEGSAIEAFETRHAASLWVAFDDDHLHWLLEDLMIVGVGMQDICLTHQAGVVVLGFKSLEDRRAAIFTLSANPKINTVGPGTPHLQDVDLAES